LASEESNSSQSTAKAREHREQERGGGWEWWERVDGDGGLRTEDGKIPGGGGGGAAAVPSAGWREVAFELDATEGQSHE
jgi:hypothetical protein